MDQILLGLGAGIFLLLGIMHGVLTLRDIASPRTFAPRDDSVRIAMAETPLAIDATTNVWRAWLGFNLSHALGIIIFASAATAIAVLAPALFRESIVLQLVAVTIAASYHLLSLAFWFWKPAIGTTIGLLCIAMAAWIT